MLECQQTRFEAVVEVGSVVTDFVGQVDQLCFKRRTLVEQVLCKLGMFRSVVVARVLDDAFAHFEREIQAAKGGVALFKVFHDAQSVQVVFEGQTVGAHGGIERFFARMAEGRVAEVMHER